MSKIHKAIVVAIVSYLVITQTGCQSQSTPGSGSAAGGAPPASGPVSLDSEEAAFVVLINQYRAAQGLTSLQVSLDLTESSQWMSQDMANNNYLGHTDSLGRDPFTRMAAFGYGSYSSAGENVAAGNSDAQSTFNQWQSSAPHNANMLDVNYAVIGVGRAYNASSGYGWYWTTDFGPTVDTLLP